MFKKKEHWLNRRRFLGAAFLNVAVQPAFAKRDRMFAMGNCQIAMNVIGAGRPAVFVHGFGANKISWQKIIPKLATTFKCYSIDLPGSGESIASNNFNYSIESMSDVLADFVVRNDLRKAAIVVHSLGSAIMLLAAIRRRDFYSRIASLCVIDGICYPQEFPYFISLLRVPILGELINEVVPANFQVSSVLSYCYFNDQLITSSQIAAYAVPLSRPQVREAMRKTARAIDQGKLAKYVPSIKSIRIPSLLIWGEDDRVVPSALGWRLHGDLAKSTFRTIPNCGHIPQEESPETVIAMIREFERSLSL